VSAPEAALGVEKTIRTLDGEEQVTLKPGTQHGTVITLRGRGIPSLRSGRPGDQHIVVNVIVPTHLSPEQRQMLERFRDTLTERNLTQGDDREDSIFGRLRRAFR
jgi:molecular chaperone DnaJ